MDDFFVETGLFIDFGLTNDQYGMWDDFIMDFYEVEWTESNAQEEVNSDLPEWTDENEREHGEEEKYELYELDEYEEDHLKREHQEKKYSVKRNAKRI